MTPTEANPPSQVGRHQSRRLPVSDDLRAECRHGSQGLGPDVLVAVLNISPGGLSALLAGPVRQGQQFRIEFRVEGQRGSLRCPARVVWTLPLERGRHLAGLCFDFPLSRATTQLFALWFQ
jgi:hypothetical protein